jgi:hypothetical protein
MILGPGEGHAHYSARGSEMFFKAVARHLSDPREARAGRARRYRSDSERVTHLLCELPDRPLGFLLASHGLRLIGAALSGDELTC